MKTLKRFLKPYIKECVLSPLFKLLEAVFELIVPLVTASLIDSGIRKGDFNYVLKMGAYLTLLCVIGLIFAISAQFFAAKAATGFASAVRLSLFEKIRDMDFSMLDRIGTDTLIMRMTSDVSQIQNGVNMFLRLLLRSPFIVFGAMIMAFTVDPESSLVFLILILVLTAVVLIVMKVSRKAYRLIQERLDTVTGKTRENLRGVRVIRAFHMEDKEREDFSEANHALFKEQERAGKISALMNPLTLLIVNLFTAALIYAGAIRVDCGGITQGEMVALLNYMAQILVELVKLANLLILVSKAAASAERVGEILDIEIPEDTGKCAFPEEKPGVPYISFENVSLKYGEASGMALENVSFTINKGSTIGITGGTGSGKSSLVSLAAGFYGATEGRILINGVDIKDIDPKAVREKTGMIFQKAELFSGSIKDNLRWGDKEADDKALWEALTCAAAYEFVSEKPGKLDFMLEQGGRNLSGGQKQRLTIARALVRKPEILIMDDCASALDLATDALLRKNIREMAEQLTIFTVSQRISSIMNSDLIIVLDEGRIAGMGKHEELLRTNDLYKEIYYSQFPPGSEDCLEGGAL